MNTGITISTPDKESVKQLGETIISILHASNTDEKTKQKALAVLGKSVEAPMSNISNCSFDFTREYSNPQPETGDEQEVDTELKA